MNTPSIRAPHPGALIRLRYMETLKLTQTDLAKALAVSVSSVNRILQERSDISSDMAVRLSHVLGGDAEIWMKLQSQHSLEKAQQKIDTSALTRLNVPKATSSDTTKEAATEMA